VTNTKFPSFSRKSRKPTTIHAHDTSGTTGCNMAGPEVESALLKHELVFEYAVVGMPDEECGRIIKAFGAPKSDTTGSETLAIEIQ
jgi:acyl-coenzyme A synthetase/AMP-(fatty) acid ligase